jgi:hypothetical protein
MGFSAKRLLKAMVLGVVLLMPLGVSLHAQEQQPAAATGE